MGKFSKFLKLVVLAGALPFVYGCGGGSGALLSMLFGPIGATGIGSSFIPDAAFTGGVAEQIATLHQPEPASMLLVGGGLAAMTYFTRRKK